VNIAASVSSRTVKIKGATDTRLEEQLSGLGLNFSLDEARKVAHLLGRDPTVVEAHIFNTMWSEHCSYKSSKDVLKEHLPTEAPNVVLGPGEDAGIVRLCEIDGKTYCVAIAHESHNHPSQIVPNEGAATGIGGIVRDVYCMGADVVGVMDPLRFGDPTGPNRQRTREIVYGVVEGIWQYGDALGVPNLGGDVYFDRSFDDNCLVNVVAVGLVEESEIKRSRVPEEARGEPYDVILVGKPTDPSGFGGATFASRILDEEKALDDKYAVQVPDPFLKRMLTVATADVLKLVREQGVAIGFKDLGAGGIACATSEVGAAAGLGVRIDLSKVPVAEEGMLPEVIACSETQERYAIVVPRGFTPHVLRIFNEDYELPELCHGARAEVIGEVIEEARFVLVHEGEVVCDASTEAITTGISYTRETRERPRPVDEPRIPADLDLADAILRVLGSPNIASREHMYRHYDSEVQGNTLVRPGEADAGVIAPIPDAFVGVAVSADGNPFLGALDPYHVESVRWIGDSSRVIGQKDTYEAIPVVSGNVSFYNQSAAGSAILPSPIVCCVGLIKDIRHHLTMGVKGTGSALYVVGERNGALGGSAFMRTVLGTLGAHVPRVRFEDERRMMAAVTDLADRDLLAACHDISDGGLIVSVVEMLLNATPDLAVGARIDLSRLTGVDDPAGAQEVCRRLFSEAGGYVLEVAPENEAKARTALHDRGLSWARVGETTEARTLVLTSAAGGDVEIPVDALARAWNGGATEVML